MLDRLRSFGRVAWRDPQLGWLAFRVYLLLIFSRVVITLFPLRHITKWLGSPMVETPNDQVTPEESRYARRVGWCIRRLSPLTPTESNCYPQALTARLLLHRKGIPSTLYYGAAFETARPALEAHVWVRCGSLIVTGGGVGRRFKPLSYFADAPQPGPTVDRAKR